MVTENAFTRCIGLVVEQHSLGVTRQVKSSEARVVHANGETCNSDATNTTKKLLACEEYDAIKQLDCKALAKLHKLGLPSVLRRGTILVPFGIVDRANEVLNDYQSQRVELVSRFLGRYDVIVRSAQQLLGPLFRAADYLPRGAVEAKFFVQVWWVDFGAAQGLREVSPGLWEDERAKLQASMKEASEEIRAVMRAGLAEVVGKLAERLTGQGESGKPKIFRDTAVTNIQDFLALFDAKNVTNDTSLAKLVDKARAVLAGVDPEDLRTVPELRAKVTVELDSLNGQLDKLVQERPVRKFSFDRE